MAPLRIVLADDHTLFREALSDLLSRHDELVVVGHASTGGEAVRAAASLRPDVVLLDLRMPEHQGTGTLQSILHASPGTRVYILSALIDPLLVRELMAAGASGYLHKGINRYELVRTLTGAADDQEPSAPASPPVEAPRPKAAFSRREDQILKCVASAMSNRQIAATLGITEGSVKRHLHNVFRKLGAVSRLDAVNKAVAAALILPPAAANEAPGAYGHEHDGSRDRDRTPPLA
ncbi:response regulator [Streptomyces sp. DSM 40750]|uniref:response regulator n=1 Tax=Streptomyces sp. DSM 40750 TaxID=2801030 RepID=UPI00214C884A|nr:response regulator transcription factor [Streptomyces sp. DSM 40750]UUU22350.1 response regulator transcription factor [Streptomyces sp. DSM 40750]